MSRLVLALVLLVLPAAAVRAAPRNKAPPAAATNNLIHVLDFQAPQYDTNGMKTAMFKGKEAFIHPDRMTEVRDLLLDIFRHSPTGTAPDVRVTSPRCFYHPDRGYAVSEDTIRIARENMVITGSNYVINAKDQRMQINHDAKVVLKGMRSYAIGEQPAAPTNAPQRKAGGT